MSELNLLPEGEKTFIPEELQAMGIYSVSDAYDAGAPLLLPLIC